MIDVNEACYVSKKIKHEGSSLITHLDFDDSTKLVEKHWKIEEKTNM